MKTLPRKIDRIPAPAGPPAAPPGGRAVALLLFVSGAVALVYEVVWQRQFALVFGSGAPATAAVLAAYFAGLGAGAWVIGRRAERWARPLRAYAALEALVGAGALLVGPLLASFEYGYSGLYASLAGNPAAFLAVRIALAFVALLIPTFCMGGTLPLLGRLVDADRHRLGLTAGWLYVANTVGAALGALAVPFFFLPRLGLAQTVWCCAAVNGAIALAAWWLDRREPASEAVKVAGAERTTGGGRREKVLSGAGTNGGRAGLGIALISGVVTFALQVLWNRAFAQVHENSMYSFAAIVAVVIFALALGAQASRVALRRGVSPGSLIGGAWLLGGAAVFAGPWMFLRLSHGLDYLPEAGGWTGHAPRLLGLASAVVLAPMALLGVALPAVMEEAGRTSRADTGRVLGRLLAVNVAGSVSGALLAGFALPHWLGLWSGMMWVALLVLAAAAAQWWRGRGAAAALGLGWIASAWAVGEIELPRVRLDAAAGERLVAIAEGTHGITAVTETRGSRRLKLNNHYALGGTAATGDERMQTHLPLLLHPAPRRVAFLGLGTGITAGGARFHPVERVTAMELVPEVVDAARRHFRAANAGVLEDPRTRVVADDARHYLRGAGERFDVIVGDLVVPWRLGEGALFTREQFEAARDALAPGGLFCQWLPLFQLSETEVMILARTFLTVFPRAQVWRGDFSPQEPALALIAGDAHGVPDPAVVRRRVAEMRPDEANPQLAVADVVWLNFVGVLEPGDLPAGETRINTEDRPWVELLGPLRAGGAQRGAHFTGWRLQEWLDRVRGRSVERWREIPEAVSVSMNAGGVLGEMTLSLEEGDRAGVMRAQARLKEMLPPEVYRAVFPE